MSLGMLVSCLVYMPAMMAFWYAAPLICWRQMSVAKAAFYSFFAVRRAGGAFAVYGLAWMGVGMFLSMMMSLLIIVITGQAYAVVLTMIPVLVILIVVMHCSFYPTYTDVFGKPGEENQSVA